MASVKATFTLDPETVTRLAQAADRLRLPKSAVVREAILDYSDRIENLGERERRRLLATFDELVPRIPERPSSEVDDELRELRASRRRGGRHAVGARR